MEEEEEEEWLKPFLANSKILNFRCDPFVRFFISSNFYDESCRSGYQFFSCRPLIFFKEKTRPPYPYCYLFFPTYIYIYVRTFSIIMASGGGIITI